MNETYTQVGRILKTHGYAGELRFHLEDPFLEDVAGAEVLYIGNQDTPLPYFIDYIKWDTIPPIVKFEDLDNKEQAVELVSQRCFLPEGDLSGDVDMIESDLEYAFLAGYQLLTLEEDFIGNIKEVLQYPQQEMAVIEHDGAEKLIPLNKDLIIRVNNEDKQVIVDLPEGLLSL